MKEVGKMVNIMAKAPTSGPTETNTSAHGSTDSATAAAPKPTNKQATHTKANGSTICTTAAEPTYGLMATATTATTSGIRNTVKAS